MECQHAKRSYRRSVIGTVVLGVVALMHSGPSLAVDGVIEINQARVGVGGITVGDQPGFPVTIDTAGSYRLTSDLTVPAG